MMWPQSPTAHLIKGMQLYTVLVILLAPIYRVIFFQLPLDESPAEIKGEHIMSFFPIYYPYSNK